MKKQIKYNNASKKISQAIMMSEKIDDFLPPPEKLVKREDNLKITILLSKSCITFFKEKSKKLGIPYQTIIKTVLDKYTMHYRDD